MKRSEAGFIKFGQAKVGKAGQLVTQIFYQKKYSPCKKFKTFYSTFDRRYGLESKVILK